MNNLALAKTIIEDSLTFKIIDGGRYFPPLKVVNEFMARGHDPADQDDLHIRWQPFEIDSNTYKELKDWWVSINPDASEDWLGLPESESYNWFTEAYDRM
jgi:hypothetical protein